MTRPEDHRLVDYLYGELSDDDARALERALGDDAELSSELNALRDTLDTVRSVEDVEPPAHLDALILAHARQAAEEITESEKKKGLAGWLRKAISSPLMGLAAAGGLAAVVAVVSLPMMSANAPHDIGSPYSALAPSAAEPADERAPAQDKTRDFEAPKATSAALKEDEVDSITAESRSSPAAKPSRSRRAGKLQPERERAKREAHADEKQAGERQAREEAQVAAGPAPVGAGAGRSADGALGGLDQGAEEKAELELRVAAAKTPAPEPARDPAPRNDEDTYAAEKKKDAVASRRAEPSAPPAARPVQPPAPAVAPDDSRAATSLADAPAEQAARAPAADESRDDGAVARARADDLARSLIQAAETELARGDLPGARRTLVQARMRTAGYPAQGRVLLRHARLEMTERRYSEAAELARLASLVPGFPGAGEARQLWDDARRRAATPDVPAASSPPPR